MNTTIERAVLKGIVSPLDPLNGDDMSTENVTQLPVDNPRVAAQREKLIRLGAWTGGFLFACASGVATVSYSLRGYVDQVEHYRTQVESIATASVDDRRRFDQAINGFAVQMSALTTEIDALKVLIQQERQDRLSDPYRHLPK